MAETKQPRLKLTLRQRAESIVRGGHPWVFSDSVREQNREGEAGELAVIYDRKNKFLAMGFYDPDSPIRVRIVHVGKPVQLSSAWWEGRLIEALGRRAGIASDLTNGLRLINGESDGWPGLVLDRYGATCVMKVYSVAWLDRLDEVAGLIETHVAPERLVLRKSRNLEGRGGAPSDDEAILLGEPLDGVVTFLENGIRFEADVMKGQKTGFFLDQRENRSRVEALSRGKEVLNGFSFSGGFSLYAARGGAKSVTDLDISEHALESARRNFALNRGDERVRECDHRCIQADAFQWIEKAKPSQFDLVIVDPPSLAKREAERERAVQAYGRLNANAIRLLRRGGILVAASCSAHVSEEEFFGAVKRAARDAGRKFEVMETRGHAADHQATFPEAQYLKAIYLKFE